jgi:hypothetical protein
MTTTWTNTGKLDNEFLLKEDSFYLLLENGSKIVLFRGTEYTNTSKNSDSWSNTSKNSSSWTNASKV